MEFNSSKVGDEICNNNVEEGESKSNENKEKETGTNLCSENSQKNDISNPPKNESCLKFSINRILNLDENSEACQSSTKEIKQG